MHAVDMTSNKQMSGHTCDVKSDALMTDHIATQESKLTMSMKSEQVGGGATRDAAGGPREHTSPDHEPASSAYSAAPCRLPSGPSGGR